MASDGGGVERSHSRKEVGIPKPSCPGYRFQGTAEEPALEILKQRRDVKKHFL